MLNERLSLIASLIRPGERVADIGTDHAYLPIFLRQSGKSSHVLACDIGEKPLAVAAENIKNCGCDGIELRLCDGLDGIAEDETDTVVIAGMGGECIAGIISRCGWLPGSGKRLLLQPMNSPEELRRALCHGFSLVSEHAVFVSGRGYTGLHAVADGTHVKEDGEFVFTGLLDPKNSCDRAFLEKQYSRLDECASPLENIKSEREKFIYYRTAANIIKRKLERE